MKAGTRTVLALLGMRCAGKSTVGRLLAQEWGFPFVDLDARVLEDGRHGGWRVESVGQLLELGGQAQFRELEASALRRVLEPSPRMVLATGGGTVERPDSRTWLARTAHCVYLAVPAEILARRLATDPVLRPPLLGGSATQEVGALLAGRESHYRALADWVIDCADEPPAEICRRIVALGIRATVENT